MSPTDHIAAAIAGLANHCSPAGVASRADRAGQEAVALLRRALGTIPGRPAPVRAPVAYDSGREMFEARVKRLKETTTCTP